MIRIKNLHDGAIRMLKTGYKKYDRDSDRNRAIMNRLFTDTLTGKIRGFYLVDDKTFTAYHKSPKKPGYIQKSVGFYRDGELIPTYDLQFGDFKDMEREHWQSGLYKIIGG